MFKETFTDTNANAVVPRVTFVTLYPVGALSVSFTSGVGRIGGKGGLKKSD